MHCYKLGEVFYSIQYPPVSSPIQSGIISLLLAFSQLPGVQSRNGLFDWGEHQAVLAKLQAHERHEA